jgi:triosephosphate isomerase
LSWVLIGHSERRQLFGETDQQVAAKARLATDIDLSIIVCIGETLTEREAGLTVPVVSRQLHAVADALPAAAWDHCVIAYEPVWAIGTGKVATKEQAQEAHAALRGWLSEHVSKEVANKTRIIYGGSVTVRPRGWGWSRPSQPA